MELKYKNWKEISVNTFKKLQANINNAEEDGDNMLNNLNKEIAMLAVLCDVDEDAIANLTQNEFSKLLTQTNFLADMPKVKVTDKYRINGADYQVFLSLKQMTVSQYIDFQTFYADTEKYFCELLACFLIPKGKKYGEGYDIDVVVKDIGEHLSIVDANSILFFFALLYRSLTKAMLSYSVRQMKKLMKKTKDKAEKTKLQTAIAEMEKAMSLLTNGDGSI